MEKTLIQSVDRALTILEIIRDSPEPLRSSDVAKKMGLRGATANNFLRSLFQRGYVAQDTNNRYLLGPECFKLYSASSDGFAELRRAAAKPVKALAEQTGDTSFFGCEYYGSLYCVSLSIGGGQLVASPEQTWLDQLHSTATGKVIIAHKGIDWYEELCQRKPPSSLSSRTILTVDHMNTEIEKINQTGYALTIGESSEDIAALGVAVKDSSGTFLGSLGQCFPTLYLETGKIVPEDRIQALHDCAQKIGDTL